jgi:hypothetical protein
MHAVALATCIDESVTEQGKYLFNPGEVLKLRENIILLQSSDDSPCYPSLNKKLFFHSLLLIGRDVTVW